MPNVGNIVAIINTALEKGSFAPRNFQDGQFNGIAEYIETTDTKEGKEYKSMSPNIIDNNGEAQILVYDDNYPFVIFHLKDGWEYGQAPEPENHGNAGNTMQEVANMKFVFIGSRKQMQVSLDNTMAAVAMDIPKEFNATQLQPLSIASCVIELGQVQTNPYDIWAQIWPGTDYEFDTDTIIFTLAYKVTTTYNKGCFNLCKTNNQYYS